ncbi:class I SAM-dependent rRNA methyltransferase [Salinibius halmophilus]|uniref:class I SAM-dependent rRNA methyltransferase n=1 Tax=Salinibius halmophilus TaxID=1853216 RepID=UPI000E66C7CA|nr:class I SAM-dependent rRNA methyltransferase [Salinibius halmophilus]
MQQVYLRSGAEKRLRSGHPWVFSNEIDTQKSPLSDLASGDLVGVYAANGKPLGSALASPSQLIALRLVSRKVLEGLSKRFFKIRLQNALALREQCFPEPFYRLVHGDSDGLPGVVIDRYGDYFAVQINSSSIAPYQALLVDALVAVMQPKGVLLRNDGKMRQEEGLSDEVVVAFGEVPEYVPCIENGVHFRIPIINGQKTGWFYDHRDNRQRLASLVKGKRVLDVCSYVGGWGVQAAVFGASEVVCLDASQFACNEVKANAELNQLSNVSAICGDAFDQMKALAEAKERFDVVIVDPPAFIRRKKDKAAGERAYQKLNELALRLLGQEGWLISASCSMHLSRERFIDIIRASGRKIDRQTQIAGIFSQAADHPIHPALPESEYIKSAMVRVLPTY